MICSTLKMIGKTAPQTHLNVHIFLSILPYLSPCFPIPPPSSYFRVACKRLVQVSDFWSLCCRQQRVEQRHTTSSHIQGFKKNAEPFMEVIICFFFQSKGCFKSKNLPNEGKYFNSSRNEAKL